MNRNLTNPIYDSLFKARILGQHAAATWALRHLDAALSDLKFRFPSESFNVTVGIESPDPNQHQAVFKIWNAGYLHLIPEVALSWCLPQSLYITHDFCISGRIEESRPGVRTIINVRTPRLPVDDIDLLRALGKFQIEEVPARKREYVHCPL